MIIADVGGLNPVDTHALGVRIRTAPGWDDSVAYQENLVQVPGREDHVNIGGDPQAEPRLITVDGWIGGDNDAALAANLAALGTALRVHQPLTDRDVEVSFSWTGPNVIAVGRCRQLEVRFIADRAGAVHPLRVLTISIECRDPRRYDISGGRPGTPHP